MIESSAVVSIAIQLFNCMLTVKSPAISRDNAKLLRKRTFADH
jgi:hypothetical protein